MMGRWASLCASLSVALSALSGVVALPPPVLAENPPSTFSVSFASNERSGTLTPRVGATPEECKVFESGTYWVVHLGGQSGDQQYTVDVNVFNSYAGPGTYTGDAASGDLAGHFETYDRSGFIWGGAPPAGTPGTLTVGASGKSGSFDLTLRPSVNSPLPLGSLMHLSGTFDCPGYGPEPSAQTPSPEASATGSPGCVADFAHQGEIAAVGDTLIAAAGEVDLAVARIEVVQAVQDSAQTVPLIANKDAVVRVFVQKLTPGDDVGAYVTLTPTGPDGKPLPAFNEHGDLLDQWPRMCVVALDGIDRSQFASNEAQFYLANPPEGNVSFAASVELAVGSGTDPNVANNSLPYSTTFKVGPPTRRMGFVAVCAGVDSAREPVGCPERPFVVDAMSGYLSAQQMFPTGNGGLAPSILPGPSWVWPGQTWWQRIDPRVNAGSLLLAWIRSRYLLVQAGDVASNIGAKPDVVVGVIGDNLGVGGDGMADFTQSGLGAGHSAWLKVGQSVQAAFPILLGQLWGLGGRDIGTCAAPLTIGEPGFGASSYRYTFKSPATADFMNPCTTSGWISPDEFKTLLSNQLRTPVLQTGSRDNHSQYAQSRAGTAAEAFSRGPALLVTGAARADGTVGELAPAITIAGATTADELSATGQFCLQLSGSSGPLQSACFDLAVDPATGAVPEQGGFSFVVPLPAGATRLVLTTNGTELDAIAATPSRPTISVDSHRNERWDAPRELSWTTSDGDGDALDVNVLYSPDGGSLWLPYAPDWPGTALTVEPSQLQAGNENMFRIIASDGFNTTSADVGPISVSNGVGQELGYGGGCEFARDCEPAKPPAKPASTGPDMTLIVAVVGLVGFVLVAGLAAFLWRGRRQQTALAPTAGASPMTTGYRAMHQVPANGLPAWGVPDASTPAATQLVPGLQVTIVEWLPNGWARVVSANGWTGWVDGRLLIPPGSY